MKEKKHKKQTQVVKFRDLKSLQTTDSPKEIIKISQGTQIIPQVRNSIAVTINKSCELCLDASTKLVKTISPIINTVSEKLKKIDWGKIFMIFLLALLEANSRKNKNSSYNYQQDYTYTEYNYNNNEQIQSTKKQSYKKVQNTNNKQIGTKKNNNLEISSLKQKLIPQKKKTQNICTNKSNIELPKQNNILQLETSKNQMIERKKQS